MLQTFTIIGLSPNGDSVAESVEAHSAAEAELALSESFESIACVLEGKVAIGDEAVYDEERLWSVFGFYTDNHQRYGATVHARSAREAEVRAHEGLNDEYSHSLDTPLEIYVCGAVLGEQMAADTYAGDEGWANAWYAASMLQEEAEAEALEQATRPLPEIGTRSRQSGLAERVRTSIA